MWLHFLYVRNDTLVVLVAERWTPCNAIVAFASSLSWFYLLTYLLIDFMFLCVAGVLVSSYRVKSRGNCDLSAMLWSQSTTSLTLRSSFGSFTFLPVMFLTALMVVMLIFFYHSAPVVSMLSLQLLVTFDCILIIIIIIIIVIVIEMWRCSNSNSTTFELQMFSAHSKFHECFKHFVVICKFVEKCMFYDWFHMSIFFYHSAPMVSMLSLQLLATFDCILIIIIVIVPYPNLFAP